jgi:hypothetical protein
MGYCLVEGCRLEPKALSELPLLAQPVPQGPLALQGLEPEVLAQQPQAQPSERPLP